MSCLIGVASRFVGFKEGGEISEAFFIVPVANSNPGQLIEAVQQKPYGTSVS